LHDYYYAKGLYTRADEVVKNPGSLITPVRQTDSKDTSAVKPSPPTKPDTVNIVTDSELLSSSELSGYALQLGSFANHENVRKLKLKLEKAGYTVALGEVIISGKHLQSVRAVGFKDKDAALAAAGELKKKYGLNPVLLPPSNSQ
jgi:cell division septation protein DedD